MALRAEGASSMSVRPAPSRGVICSGPAPGEFTSSAFSIRLSGSTTGASPGPAPPVEPPEAPPSVISAKRALVSTVEPSPARISVRTPDAGLGTSTDTLSVSSSHSISS